MASRTYLASPGFMAEARDALYREVLKRYPCCPDLPELPKSSLRWGEAHFEMFIESMGLIMPQVEDQCVAKTANEIAVAANAAGEAQPVVENSSQAGNSAGCIRHLHTPYASLVIPSTIYMEDRAPAGLKLEAILTKFDRCRAAALQSICGVNLKILSDEYGVGILLSDLTIILQGPPPALISNVDVESEVDLPKMPFVPSRQRLVDPEGNVSCSAFFGQLLVDLSTKRLSTNQDAYNRLKLPCDRIFERDVPNLATLAIREELSARVSQVSHLHESQGRPFTPTRYLRGMCIITPSDCDSYDTLYHPRAPTVCEHACLSTGEKFCCLANTAFYCKFLAPLPPGLQLAGHIFVDDSDGSSTRCLVALEDVAKGDGSCAMCAFSVYGGPIPGVLYNEEVQAVNPKTAQGLVKWATQGSAKHPDFCDLSIIHA